MKDEERYRFETNVIHYNYHGKEYQDSLNPPIFQTSTYTFSSAESGEKRFAGEEEGYIYSRLGNPTVKLLEDRMAVLEGGEAGLAFGSGMAAVSALLIGISKTGDHILCSQGIYGCTFGLLQMLNEKFGITHDFSNMSTKEEIRQALRPETVCIYIETPINPTMKLVDLELVCEVAKEVGVLVVVDNTFCSPYLQKPLTIGADVVIHSATKYIGGHGDVIAGILVGKQKLVQEIAVSTQKDIGGVLSPFDAWLLLRGLKTLALRMDRHCHNAAKLADYLISHNKVEKVYYPGDKNHGDYDIMQKQMTQPGGMISFTIKGDKQDAQKFMNHLRLIKIAVSLGDAETLIQHPASMTHAVVPIEHRRRMGIEDHLLRLSVGLEAWEDIQNDLDYAFRQL